METKEIWKDVPDYEGYYQVSNLGRVKSLERLVNDGQDRKRHLKERILKASVSPMGYLHVVLCKDAKTETFSVHKLVAIAFLGHKPCGRIIVVDHIDNDKLNNKVENLQITTQRHNIFKDRKGTSKYVGVCWHKASGKWNAQIQIKGKVNHLGLFDNELEAAEAYQNALKGIGGYNG